MKARYKQLVDRFAVQIRTGELPPGTRLPTHRCLAGQEHISLATATRVYRELEAMGLVSGETGRGTFVREIALPPGHGIDQLAVASDVLDLNFNYPAVSGQGELLREALKRTAVEGNIEAHLRYQPHGGRITEREVFAAHFTQGAFRPAAEDLLLVNGAQHGLTIAVMGLLKPGDVVAVDALTYPGFKALAELYHLELVAIPAAQDGPDLAALRQLCQQRRIRAVYAMPTMHNPLGWVMNRQSRKTLADIARVHDLLIIEDAAYAWLVRRAPPPLACFAPERTVYVSGFSKNVATGLRVGVVISPPALRPVLERAIRATTWNAPSLMTSLVSHWIEEGTVADLEKRKREDARLRQRILQEILAGLPCVTHPDSYFAWLPLAEESRADRVVKQLMDSNISLSTAEPFCTAQSTPQALRVALGSVAIDTLREALLTIREAIEYEASR